MTVKIVSPRSDVFVLENIYRANCHNENMTKPSCS